MTNILEIKQLSKNYGSLKAVKTLDLEIPQGAVYGLLGPNGSGKTTILGMVLQVINPSSGTFSWFGEENSNKNRRKLGAILENPIFYPYLSAQQNLKITAQIKNMPYERIEVVLKMVNLFERKNDAFRRFSLGMKQRLAIASALLSDPQVLILDEPTNGLDPQGIAEIRQIIVEIAKQNKTIVLASHLLDEVEKVCTHVCVMQKGEKLYSGTVEELLESEEELEIKFDHYMDSHNAHNISENEIKTLLDNCHLVKSYHNQVDNNHSDNYNDNQENSYFLKLNDGYKSTSINKYFAEKNIYLSQIMSRKKSLETQFLELLKK